MGFRLDRSNWLMRWVDMKIVEYKLRARSAVSRSARVLMVATMTSMLGACSTMDLAGDKVVDYASTLNPLNWFGDEEAGTKKSWSGGTTEAAETASVDNSDAKRKSRSSKVPSGALYGDNRVKKYPKLGTMPDSPKAHKSLNRQLERAKLAQGLIADTKNAQYSEQTLGARVAVKPPIASPTTPVAAQQINAPTITPPSAPAIARPPHASLPSAPSVPRVQVPSVQPPQQLQAVKSLQTPQAQAVTKPVPQAPSPAPRIIKAAGSSVVPRAQQAVAAVKPRAQPGVPAPFAVPPPPPPPTTYKEDGASVRFATPSGVPRVAAIQSPPARQNVTPPPKPPHYNAKTPVAATAPVQRASRSPQVAALPLPAYAVQKPSSVQKAVQVATIYFKNGSSRLGARDRVVVQDVVSMYRETGGIIRIIGHSSGFAASQVSGRSKLVNFKVSLDRANAVAAELIRHGVQPGRIDVSAQGTENPRYAEYLPTGEAGNRRAEVFLDYANGS